MTLQPAAHPLRFARAYRALSDEMRLRIVEMLSTGEHCVCDLQSALGVYQSRLSFHLRKLKDAGLVTDRRSGRWVHYSLNPDVLDELGEHLASLRPSERTSRSEECCV